MNLSFQRSARQLIVYDADCIQRPETDWFYPEYWRQKGMITGHAPGRGSAWILDTPFGNAVLRKCLRGGRMAHLSREKYLFTGYHNSRPIAEMQLLARLQARTLPVPQPLAGLCRRSGLTYTGALLTRLIAPAKPLAEILMEAPVGLVPWFRIGQCIRRFHDAGVVHPDLNARNILLGANPVALQDIYLLDFDKADVREGNVSSSRSNLPRLHRSLQKLWPAGKKAELPTCWQKLTDGYNTSL
ncbi:MAG: 3-deoxy-D-manno-octulosonic acid kinase [Lysobacterales bacterium]